VGEERTKERGKKRYNASLPHARNVSLVTQGLHGLAEPVPEVIEILLLHYCTTAEELCVDVVEVVH